MNHAIHPGVGVLTCERPDPAGNHETAASAAERRLSEIRRLSNIAQALENLAAQCAGLDAYAPLFSGARRELDLVRAELRARIHEV